MKTLIILSLIIFTNLLWAGLTSPIKGTVLGLDIPNSHEVGSEIILRGQTPRDASEYKELKSIGVKSVLIFKNETRNEVQTEIQTLNSLKIKSQYIPFPWKEIKEFSPACENVKSALQILNNNLTKNVKTYFHCTVGEDRTGLLAGLFLISEGSSDSIKSIFQNELCAKGYEAGDHNKDANVSQIVRENLTPIFLKMAYLLKNSNNDVNALDCNYDFDSDNSFLNSFYNRPTSFHCGN